MKRHLLSLAIATASLSALGLPSLLSAAPANATQPASISTLPDPAAHVREGIQRLRDNDLQGLLQVTLPPAHYQALLQAWEHQRGQPIDEAARRKFEEGPGRLLAPDGVEQLMAEIEPKLAAARPQAQGAILVGLGALQMALASPDSDFTEEQRAALRLAMPGLERWIKGTDFLSSRIMREALTLVAEGARRSGVQSLDDLRQLSPEQALARAGTLLGAAKQAVRLYGIDLDAIADTAYVEVIEFDGERARVRSTVTVFDAPLSREFELVLVDGRWYGGEVAGEVRFDFGNGGVEVEIDDEGPAGRS